MILRVDCYSLWMPDAVLKKRSDWKFFHNGKSQVFRGKDLTGEVAGFLKVDSEVFLPRLKEYLNRGVSVVGVEVKDGLYVKFEALGKFLFKEMRKRGEM